MGSPVAKRIASMPPWSSSRERRMIGDSPAGAAGASSPDADASSTSATGEGSDEEVSANASGEASPSSEPPSGRSSGTGAPGSAGASPSGSILSELIASPPPNPQVGRRRLPLDAEDPDRRRVPQHVQRRADLLEVRLAGEQFGLHARLAFPVALVGKDLRHLDHVIRAVDVILHRIADLARLQFEDRLL